ncbi:amino acid adenylation domain-containing protein [Actinoplanes subtropicus]|uniref:amino acid adenylation domain-containing protein n=1 Tax=Actinoplanes subtropicus TaxID=543632 RepID=UPI00248026FF|nr:amino acid adenylation domain-containing protein [Actinoplanes subtropicus]
MTTSATSPASALAEVWPLSPTQEGMVYHSSFDDAAPDLHLIQESQFIDGPLDAALFRRSWEVLLDRHAALRACFHRRKSGETVQLIPRRVELPWAEYDLSDLAENDASAEVEVIAEKERARKFDLAKAPLLRLVLIRLGPARHCLITTSHHVLTDGWSQGILRSDLLDIYEAGGVLTGLKPAGSYRDYLAWLNRQDKEAARAAWRAELSGADGSALGTPEAPGKAPELPARRVIRHSPEFTSALVRFARRHELTLNTLVQGAWALVLSRLARRTDVVFGATVAGRPPELPGVEECAGLFINTVPVRVRLDGAQPVLRMLTELQQRQSALITHHHLGLPEIQKLGGASFDTILVFENYADPAAASGGARRLRLTLRDYHQASPYAIALGVTPGESLQTEAQYHPEMVGVRVAEDALDALTRVLGRIIAEPEAPVGRLDVVGAADRELTVERWNRTGEAVRASSPVELFRRQAAKAPDATAMVAGERSWSFRELDEWSGRLARALIDRGVRRGDRVAVMLERSAEVLAAWLGVWRAGAAFVPVDPGYPPDRVAFMLADSGVSMVLGRAGASAAIPPDYEWLAVEEAGSHTGDVPPVVIGPADLAYVMYTSGSTGTPKGVAIPHGGVAALAGDPGWEMSPGDTVLMHAPHTFDASLFDVWVPLLSGARVMIAEPGVVDAARLAAHVADGLTAVNFTAGQFRALAQESPESFAGLRAVSTGGDVVPIGALERVRQACPRLRVWHSYGPTETTLCASWMTIEPGDRIGPVLPIGRPLPGRRLYVLDVFLRPLPPGVAGDLYLAGAGLARGYLGSPALTGERFVADPFASGERMYRTGDVAYWTDDGELVFAGRADNQVKIRGYRVEPGEIETALTEQPGVDQAVVLARDERLIGYVVSGTGVDPVRLREQVARTLPSYLVPAAVLVLDALPVTVNGKVDREALPDPDFGALVSEREPATPAERVLCGLFAEVLGLERVGVEDSFFELGGDSITSMRLAARARRDGLIFGAREVFEHRTPAGIAAVVEPGNEPPSGAAGDVPWTPVARLLGDGVLAAGFAQWVVVAVPADLTEEVLRAGLAAVVDRHDMLRLRARPGRLVVGAPGSVDAADLVRRVPVGRAAVDDVARAAVRAAVGRLRPADGTVVQAEWVDAGPDRLGRLVMAVHHLAVDEESWRVLVPDVRAACEALAAGREPAPPPVPVSFRRWAARLGEWAVTPERVAELAGWHAIAGVEDRPIAGPGPASGETCSRSWTMSGPAASALVERLPAVFFCEVHEVLLAGLAGAVARWRGGGPVLVDVAEHGRHSVDGWDLSRTVGWFTSVHPVRLDLAAIDWAGVPAGGRAAGELLKVVKEQSRAVPGDGLGYGMLRFLNRETRPVLAALPAARIGFTYRGRHAAGVRMWQTVGGVDGAAGPVPGSPHALEAVAKVEDAAEGPRLTLVLSWPGGLLAEEDVERLGRAWLDTLSGLAAQADDPSAGGHTASDFVLDLDQDEIEEFEADFGDDR